MTEADPSPQQTAGTPAREARPDTHLPVQEKEQPDPMLQMSTGRMGGLGVTLAVIALAVILGVVFYAIDRQPTADQTAAAPPAAHSSQPAAGGQAGPPAPTAPQTTPRG